jgi:hypothetical protein
MSLNKHLKNKNVYGSIACILLLIVAGCSRQEKQESYIAKVDNSVLTETQLKEALAQDQNKSKFRSEFINDWIETEILYQQAEKEGILKEERFNSLLERSKKHLAVALFIEKVIEESKIEVSEEEINNYYEANKNDFKLIDDAYRINIINFSDFDKAVSFRLSLMESDWSKTTNNYSSEKSIVNSEASKLLFTHQIQPVALLRIITNLQPGEVSIVLETEPMKFTVVQLIEKLDKGSVPQLEFVKNDVNTRIIMLKKKDLIRNYIDKLITDHNFEIVRYSE